MALEPEFWAVLELEAERAQQGLAALVARIDKERGLNPLASALRLYALQAARAEK